MKKKILIYILIILLIGIIITLYGVLSSRNIIVNYHEIDKDFELKISHFSDTHFDNSFTEDDYMIMVDTINEEEVDVVFFTGDLFEVDTISDELEDDIITYLSKIECNDKFAVLGNHDYSHGEDFTAKVIMILELSGFIVLQNDSRDRLINSEHLRFIGLDDYMYGDRNYDPILDTLDDQYTTFILSHEPDTFNEVIDMNITGFYSGHSHGGQVRIPLIGDIVNPPGAKTYNNHHYEFEDKDLFVSFGMGETIIKIRFFNHRQFEIYNYS